MSVKFSRLGTNPEGDIKGLIKFPQKIWEEGQTTALRDIQY